RAAAARVDDDLSNFMRAHGIAGPWPTLGRLLVCIDATPASENILRTAKRLADQRHLPWTALYVQTLGAQHYASKQAQLEANLALAAELGSESASITADRVGEGIVEYARMCNAAQIVVGRPRSTRWQRLLRGSLAEWLFDHGKEFEITVVSGESADEAKHETKPPRNSSTMFNQRTITMSLSTTLVATLAAALLIRFAAVEDLLALFLIAVAAAGALGGLASAWIACALCFLSYNFFFTEPRFSFHVYSVADVRSLVSFLIVGTVVGLLSGRLKRQAVDARTNTLRTAMLFDFTRRLASAVSEHDLRNAAASGIQEILHTQCLVIPCDLHGKLWLSAEQRNRVNLRQTELAAADWAIQHHEMAGAGTKTLPASSWCFLPVIAGQHSVGVIALEQRSGGHDLSDEERRLLYSLQAQLTTAWERFQLLKFAEDAKVQRTAEGLRSALLASVSHDLRTPLVSVIGSLTAIRELSGQLNEQDQSTLVTTALDEAERLNRLIQNLLDATRLAQGGMSLSLEPVHMDDVIHSAIQRLPQHSQSRIKLLVPVNLLPARADRALLEQTLVNIFENALKYSPVDSAVTISAEERGGRIVTQVADMGPGIESADRSRVFDFFYRAKQSDSAISGSGLGLAICKGFVEAMGGTINAQPGNAQTGTQTGEQGIGTTFVIELPIDDTGDKDRDGLAHQPAMESKS
ncbi:MAG TPA: ATP-binding protein, partial [Steroidobacteraceae bacterium]|nr:ATP-binding protein [Steroidobacteraceae bacterium]